MKYTLMLSKILKSSTPQQLSVLPLKQTHKQTYQCNTYCSTLNLMKWMICISQIACLQIWFQATWDYNIQNYLVNNVIFNLIAVWALHESYIEHSLPYNELQKAPHRPISFQIWLTQAYTPKKTKHPSQHSMSSLKDKRTVSQSFSRHRCANPSH